MRYVVRRASGGHVIPLISGSHKTIRWQSLALTIARREEGSNQAYLLRINPIESFQGQGDVILTLCLLSFSIIKELYIYSGSSAVSVKWATAGKFRICRSRKFKAVTQTGNTLIK